MCQSHSTQCTAFEGSRRIASGDLVQVAAQSKEVIDRGGLAPVLIFDDVTSELVEVDFRGTVDDVVKRLEAAGTSMMPEPAQQKNETPRGRGRPRLGVVAHEVTLLPRHWDWLNNQPGGASVTLRRLVEQARRANEGADRVRRSQDAAYRFMAAMAGDLPGFEEATRALFAGDESRFDALVAPWPDDLRAHAKKLATVALRGPETECQE